MDKKTRQKSGWSIYWLVVLLALAFVCIGVGKCQGAMAEAIDATCRISAGHGAMGTGCAFERSQGQVYVLTCAHVVGSSRNVQCEFWLAGHKSRLIPGVVVARSPQSDSAVIAIPQAAFGGMLPKTIPVAAPDYVARRGDTIVSVGCANGSWSTGWKGHVISQTEGELHFVPPPANGRSGSAIFDAKAEKIVGLVRARMGDDSTGIATSIPGLYLGLGTKRTQERAAATIQAQCPGGVCPPGSEDCDRYVLPYRWRQEQQRPQQPQQPQQPIYPTLPYYPPPATPAPSIDLGPTNQKLDTIAKMLSEMWIQIGPPPPASPISSDGVDMRLGHIEQKMMNQQIGADKAQAEVQASTEQVSKLGQVVNQLVGDRETLLERFQERLDKVKVDLGEGASRREVVLGYVKDLVGEKLGDGTVGLTGGKILGGALGLSAPLALAIGVGLWFLGKRIGSKVESGEPLLVQRLIERVTDKVDLLRERVAPGPAGGPTPAPVQPAVQPIVVQVAPPAAPAEALHAQGEGTATS